MINQPSALIINTLAVSKDHQGRGELPGIRTQFVRVYCMRVCVCVCLSLYAFVVAIVECLLYPVLLTCRKLQRALKGVSSLLRSRQVCSAVNLPSAFPLTGISPAPSACIISLCKTGNPNLMKTTWSSHLHLHHKVSLPFRK